MRWRCDARERCRALIAPEGALHEACSATHIVATSIAFRSAGSPRPDPRPLHEAMPPTVRRSEALDPPHPPGVRCRQPAPTRTNNPSRSAVGPGPRPYGAGFDACGNGRAPGTVERQSPGPRPLRRRARSPQLSPWTRRGSLRTLGSNRPATATRWIGRRAQTLLEHTGFDPRGGRRAVTRCVRRCNARGFPRVLAGTPRREVQVCRGTTSSECVRCAVPPSSCHPVVCPRSSPSSRPANRCVARSRWTEESGTARAHRLRVGDPRKRSITRARWDLLRAKVTAAHREVPRRSRRPGDRRGSAVGDEGLAGSRTRGVLQAVGARRGRSPDSPSVTG